MGKKWKNYGWTLIGLVAIIVGTYFLDNSASEGWLYIVPSLCVGAGCILLGCGVSRLREERAEKKNPALEKQRKIAHNDERNVVIVNQSKANAFDRMIVVFGVLFMALALMKVELVVIVLLVAAYLFVVGSEIYDCKKLEKEM
ncbi:MAG: hypothetical protein IJV50_00830 [Lachnospiraceae bacterium]|nr:hypothetical protein [Lachnospiraceae bacterium]